MIDRRAVAIRTIARTKGTTLATIARRTGIDTNRVQRITNGIREGTDSEFDVLARRGLGMDLDDVLAAHERIVEALAGGRR